MSTPIKLVLLFIGAVVMAFATRSLYVSLFGDDSPIPSDPPVQIRAAGVNLPAGLLLRDEDLEWRATPKSAVPAGAVVEGSKAANEIVGVMVRRDIAGGSPIMERDIIRPSAPGFLSAVLKPGMRAVSVAVDNVSGNAGLIQPGDFVDVILVQETSGRGNSATSFGFPEAEAKARSVVSETIVEEARVIAVGSEFLQYQEENGARKEDGVRKDTGRNAARTITLEVKPRAAEAIAVAARLGTITLALRSFALADRDEAPEDVGVTWEGDQASDGPLWAGDVSRAISSAASRGQAPSTANSAGAGGSAENLALEPHSSTPHNITIYRGSEQSTQTLGSTINR